MSEDPENISTSAAPERDGSADAAASGTGGHARRDRQMVSARERFPGETRDAGPVA
ncbi:hypothetical protein [Pseudonocardia sp. HH130629-09]|uniref:hypothetical protein n=1 Tax=Pseudonocardia sp. HH130629-09 TaxID=1641402 RepID=UPI000B00F3C7|nr:hypothetical protein [Pseudonocardia sp. HH130629-09]